VRISNTEARLPRPTRYIEGVGQTALCDLIIVIDIPPDVLFTVGGVLICEQLMRMPGQVDIQRRDEKIRRRTGHQIQESVISRYGMLQRELVVSRIEIRRVSPAEIIHLIDERLLSQDLHWRE